MTQSNAAPYKLLCCQQSIATRRLAQKGQPSRSWKSAHPQRSHKTLGLQGSTGATQGGGLVSYEKGG